MQQKNETGKEPTPQTDNTQNLMAQNPNPRANENIQNTSFEKSDATEDTTDVGSEITDGEAS